MADPKGFINTPRNTRIIKLNRENITDQETIQDIIKAKEILSEFKVNTSGEKILPLPLVKLIGIVLPEYSIGPVVPVGIINSKSESEYTSIYPPVPSTLKLVPNTSVLFTDVFPNVFIGETGFL